MAMASLTASLLARKGQARPSAGIHFEPTPQAMRPASPVVANQSAATPVKSPVRLAVEQPAEQAPVPRTEVRAEPARMEAIVKRPAIERSEPRPVVSKTLRVDQETHIKLRLLAAGRGVTQQSLMEEAVKSLLAVEEGKDGCLCGAAKKQ